ncbi:MAG: threonylcarbamoyl-AMP synthase [Phycisphaerales bacterium]|nr:threonylcarbamoyl-AMP synthase [Phycisphaerales bacterium]
MAAILSYTDENIDLAAAQLRAGSVVAFATETVYGLGADTFNPEAIAKIYELKRRPSGNPLIAHVIDLAAAQRVSSGWSRRSLKLISACWPGPLTVILPRRPEVPASAAGGFATIAVRSPRHPLARSLLYACGGAISAPSANRSGGVSPTTAQHVADDYEDQQDLIVLDGGPCTLGIESTVIDLSESKPVVRRLGAVTIERLSELLGPIEVDMVVEQGVSPGSSQRHYAPTLPSTTVESDQLAQMLEGGSVAAVLCMPGSTVPAPHVRFEMPADAEGYAARVYDALRKADHSGCERIVIERPGSRIGLWSAIQDRLTRATTAL